MKKFLVTILFFISCANFVFAQENAYYLPYELPGHSAVKFNTYLFNPALPILGQERSHIAFYHRNQWLNYKNHFTTNAISYGKKWTSTNMFHGMIFQKKAGVFSNFGVLGNYIHQVEISDDNYLRLGVNLMIGMSGISQSDIIVNQTDDPLLANVSNSGMINLQPGFDINFGAMHFGLTAENLLDYAFSSSEMAVPFAEKSLTGHAMYRYEMLSGYGMLEEAVFQVMLKAKATSDNMQLGGNIVLDMPNLGWVYGGYDRKYGVFAGLGFNVSSHFSAGFSYEQGIGTYASNLGGSYDLVLAYQFGGDRHIRAKQLREKVEAKEREKELAKQKKAEEAAKPKIPEKEEAVVESKEKQPTTPATPTTPKKEEVKKPADPIKELEMRLRVREDKIANEIIKEGYYVVVGVFGNKRNAYRFIQSIKDQGVNASGFVNPITNMTYVYLDQPVSTPNEAGEILSTNLKKKGFEGIWILKVTQ